MRAYLKFDLDKERPEFEIALAGQKLLSAIQELDNWLRDEVKYRNRENLQEIRDKLSEILQDHGLDIWSM